MHLNANAGYDFVGNFWDGRKGKGKRKEIENFHQGPYFVVEQIQEVSDAEAGE